MPQPYLLQVQSHPIRVPRDTWQQWYTEEHLRDMVYFHACKCAAFYKSSNITNSNSSNNTHPLYSKFATPEPSLDHKEFLALYQTDRKHCLDYPEYKDHVRLMSELWDPASTCHDVGSFAPVDLELVEILGSYAYCEDVAPRVIQCKITGHEVEGWLRHEHVNAASRLRGYRRSLVYRPIRNKTETLEREDSRAYDLGRIDSAVARPFTGPERGEDVPSVVLLHEFDEEGEGDRGLEGVMEELEAIEESEKYAIVLRDFRLVSCEGFGRKVRTPERLKE